MNCKQFKERLDEFADGVAGVADDPERVAHANSCPSCRSAMQNIESLTRAVQRIYGSISAPQASRHRLRATLSSLYQATPPPRTMPDAQQTSGSGLPARNVGQDKRHQVRRPSRAALVPIAAAIVLVALALGPLLRPARVEGPIVVYVRDPVLEAARQRHTWCSREEHVFHRDADIPDDEVGIASALESDLGIRVFAPSLRRFGFHLVGAKRCRVSGVPVAHLLYFASRDSIMLSLFSMYRVSSLETTADSGVTRRYFGLSAPGPTTLAWLEGPWTYVACSSLHQHELVGIVESVRIQGGAAGGGPRYSRSALATAPSPALRDSSLGFPAGAWLRLENGQ